MIKIAAIGDNDVDCYLKSGLMYAGGNCLNVSVFSRRFGASSAYIGAVGNDFAGQFTRETLEAAGVDLSRLRVLNGNTAFCLIDHVKGDRVFRASDLGVSRFEPSSEDLDFLTSFDAAHVGQSSGLDDFVPAIASKVALSYDFSTRYQAKHGRTIAPYCFLASISASELTDAQLIDLKETLLSAGAKWVLLTRGDMGAMLFNSQNKFSVPALKTDVVDTLGAGDTFIARTLIGLLQDEEPESILQAAAKASAETCGYLGPHGKGTEIRLNQDLDRFLQSKHP